jgi:hypothetical protein
MWSGADTYAVFRLGQTYWVRGTSWGAVNVLDDQFRRIATFIYQ